MKVKSPMDLWLTGEGSVTCLEDAVDAWHDMGDSYPVELREYLGMTSEVYALYALKPSEFEKQYPYGSHRNS
jgi:hypothetical protein